MSATPMIERAARGICVSCSADPETLVLVEASLPQRVSVPRWQSVTEDAECAVRGALDLTDDEMTALACAIAQGSHNGWNAAARAAVDALRQCCVAKENG